MMSFSPKSRAALAAFSVALLLSASIAEARVGRGGAFGSRGMRTFSPPPVTRTAPQPAQPIQRSVTQPGAQQPGAAARAPAVGQAARPGFLNRPRFMGGLFAGLLGAGLIGMLFGSGFFGGLAGFGSFLGLLLQLALIFFLVRWAMRAFARRSEPAYAGGPAPGMDSGSGLAPLRRTDLSRAGSVLGGMGMGQGARGGLSGSTENPDELGVSQADLDAFERLLGEIQAAYSAEDLAALGRLATPEMVSYFAEELADDASRGVMNRVTDVKLLSGDVAESWREGDREYATAAMHFALRDETFDRNTNELVEVGPSEATELWTFRRAPGGNWLLSAIQQA